MKTTLKHRPVLFLYLIAAVGAYSAIIGVPIVISHQKAILARVESNVDFKFQVTSGEASVVKANAYYSDAYNPPRLLKDGNPYLIADIDGTKYYFIKLQGINESHEGKYTIEVINSNGSGFAESFLTVSRD